MVMTIHMIPMKQKTIGTQQKNMIKTLKTTLNLNHEEHKGLLSKTMDTHEWGR